MHSYTLASKESPNKQGAFIDAKIRNERNIKLWSSWHLVRAGIMMTTLKLIYRAKGFYISYGTKGISVKVHNVHSITDHKMLKDIEKNWAANGVFRKFTDQGVIYRFN